MREKRGKKPKLNSSFDKLIKVKLHGKLNEIFLSQRKLNLHFYLVPRCIQITSRRVNVFLLEKIKKKTRKKKEGKTKPGEKVHNVKCSLL